MTNQQIVNNALNRTYTAISILKEVDAEKLIAIYPNIDIKKAIDDLQAFDQLICDCANGVKNGL